MSWRNVLQRLCAGDLAYVYYTAWIRVRGLDLLGATVEELGLSPERSAPHANSGGPDLARVLHQISIPAGSRIVDFGSGKGGSV
jgi:hypothetical protein